MAVRLALALSLVFVAFAAPQDTASDQTRSIPLTVPAGVPLRLYLTKRVPKRSNAPVDAKLLTPVYAFDHVVIPAGTQVLGHVVRVQSVSRWERTRAILGGDFTPLHVVQIKFTSLLLADGRSMELHTIESPGLNSLVPLNPPKQQRQNAPSNNGGILDASRGRGMQSMLRSRALGVSPTWCTRRARRHGCTITRCPGCHTTRNPCEAGPGSMRNSSLPSISARKRSLTIPSLFWVRSRLPGASCMQGCSHL
jgi:hypothetical protein